MTGASMSAEQARILCKKVGGRVCSYPEIVADVAAGTGCGYDRIPVWTSTQCDKGRGLLVVAGAHRYKKQFPRTCEPHDAAHGTRCCADNVVPTTAPTAAPTSQPTLYPTDSPAPTPSPTDAPTALPTAAPTPAKCRVLFNVHFGGRIDKSHRLGCPTEMLGI